MTKTYTARRKANGKQWQQSGHSARQFCEEQSLMPVPVSGESG